MKIIPKSIQQTTEWSGGRTTELAIFPPEASYTNRNFEFRISTATVETETSTFTSLPGYKRLLMILKGELEITHIDQYTKKLAPFETDTFDGGWQTSAKGMVTDFNIMYAPDKKVNISMHAFTPEKSVSFFSTAAFHYGYVVSGIAFLDIDSMVHPGDFVALPINQQYTIQGETTGIWLSIEIE
jgi:environmental stress-induced protein Ves